MKSQIIAFVLSLTTFLFVACNDNETFDPSTIPESTTHVSLNIGPSIEQSELPIESRSSNEQPRGLYAINVYWKGKSLRDFQPYVSGLFDDVSQVNISLINGYEYRFDCSFLPEKDIPYVTTENGIQAYGLPFAMGKEGQKYAPVTNKLVVSLASFDSNLQFYQGIYSGKTEVAKGKSPSLPSNHRYYGKGTADLTKPTDPSVHVDITLLRAYCTLKFESDNIPEGDTIRVTLEGTSPFSLIGTGTKAPIYSQERLLALSKTADRKSGEITKSDPIPILVEYYSSIKEEWHSIYQQAPTINLNRNKRNNIKFINIDQATGGGQITVGEGEIAGTPTDSEQQEIQ